jgi:hypothetical protein
MRVPARPPLEGLRKRLNESRSAAGPRDGFVRQTYTLPRVAARAKAREWFERWPKQAYWTSVESWRERPEDLIEFTMRRLESAD